MSQYFLNHTEVLKETLMLKLICLICLILGEDPTQGLEHTLSAEKMYSIDFIENNKTSCLSFHYNGANSQLFLNDT